MDVIDSLAIVTVVQDIFKGIRVAGYANDIYINDLTKQILILSEVDASTTSFTYADLCPDTDRSLCTLA